MSLVLTKAALALKNAETNFKVVKFEAHKSKAKKSSGEQLNEGNTPITDNIRKDIDLKKIRHEVVKFGMQGFDAPKKEEAKIALAVSLGAKPPKREYVNYKELMQKRKEEKKKKLEEKLLMQSKAIMYSAGKAKHKKNKVGNDVGHFLSSYGKVQKKDLNQKDSVTKKKKKK